MKSPSIVDTNLLKHAVENGIIDLAYVLVQSANLKRSKLLKQHKTEYWHSKGKEDCWYWRNPDKKSNPERSKVKRKNQKDIEQVIFDYYIALEQEKERQTNLNVMSFEKLFYEMIDDKRTKRATGTIRKNMQDWRKYIKPHSWFIEKPFKDITKIDVDKLFNSVVNNHHLKDTGFGNMLGIVKQSFDYAVDSEYLEKSPYRVNVNKKLVEKSRKKKGELEVFQPHEQEKLILEQERRLQNNPSNTANLAIILDFEIGIRKGEMLALRESDIDYTKNIIHISRQFVGDDVMDDIDNINRVGYKVANYTKSDNGNRTIPLTPKALILLRRIEEINEKHHQPYKDYLFIRDGYIIPPNAIDTQLRRGCDYLGIKVRTMHKIRKTYASTLYKRGIDVLTISKLLGHADIKTTFENYIFELEDEDKIFNDVVNALQGDIKSKKVTKSDQKIVAFQEIKRRRTS